MVILNNNRVRQSIAFVNIINCSDDRNRDSLEIILIRLLCYGNLIEKKDKQTKSLLGPIRYQSKRKKERRIENVNIREEKYLGN